MSVTMKVQSKYYQLLKSGQKKVELRLYDEKRQAIHVGDTIVFSDLSDASDCFTAHVVHLYLAENFSALCHQILPQWAGFSSQQELLDVLEEFYSPDQQRQYGVVGIEIEKI